MSIPESTNDIRTVGGEAVGTGLFQRIPWLMSIIFVVLLLVLSMGTVIWNVALLNAIHPDPTQVRTLQDNVIGSLRYCIENASPKSIIHFDPDLHGIIHLKESLSFLGDEQLTIQGPGANKIIISNGNNSYANVQVPLHATVTISGLSFKGSQMTGYAFLFNAGTLNLSDDVISDNRTTTDSTSFGGAIYNSATGTLNIQKSVISNNSSNSNTISQGGSIVNEGMLDVRNSHFADNEASSSNGYSFGGTIENARSGTIEISTSTFLKNTASGGQDGIGGSIYNEGTLIVFTSTFSNNQASSSGESFGGAIANNRTGIVIIGSSAFSGNMASGKQGGQGGGIANEGLLNVAESTFWKNTASGGNDAGGGAISFVGFQGLQNSSTTIQFCTITGNTSSAGGGIWVDRQSQPGSGVEISGSIVAANKASNGPDVSGALFSDGHNLLTNVDGVPGLNAGTDRQITFSDLKLDTTLRNNGGPTQTLALLPGSLAIDAVPLQACDVSVNDGPIFSESIVTDQRLRHRPDGSENACDIGAYESSY